MKSPQLSKEARRKELIGDCGDVLHTQCNQGILIQCARPVCFHVSLENRNQTAPHTPIIFFIGSEFYNLSLPRCLRLYIEENS